MVIIPAVLVQNTNELKYQLHKVEPLFSSVHIDIMDGALVPARSEIDPVALVGFTTPLRYELHLMVNDPVAEMRRWQAVEQVFRVLFHREAPVDPLRPISFAKREGWEKGLVLNPETPLSEVESYLDKIDLLQFMTVQPGRQGAPFVPEVLEKIKQFTQLPQRPLCAVDGAVNRDTIRLLRDAGVEICNVGSAIMKAEDMRKAYEELLAIIN